jgi:hypothetical protein
VVNASGDPTEQWALGGGLRPIPVSFLADHDNTIDVTSEVLGPLPSGYPVGYAVSAIICLQLQAVGSKVNDTRQGAPRPLDLGRHGFCHFFAGRIERLAGRERHLLTHTGQVSLGNLDALHVDTDLHRALQYAQRCSATR